MNASDYIVKVLAHIGVKHIYGIPGEAIDAIFDALNRQTDTDIELILMRHEEVGAFAASGYAKLTGKLGVCIACQGPGAIHLVNGLYDANLDRVPVLALTGQTQNSDLGVQIVQDIDQVSLFNNCTVYNREVRNAQNLENILPIAIRAAINKRGVAHLSLPFDVLISKATYQKPMPISVYYEKFTESADEEEVKTVATTLNQADKVTIFYGGGSRTCADELIELGQALKAPLVHTTRSKDIIPSDHPLYVGGIGFMGCLSGNSAIQECEVLLVVGSNFAFREFYPKNARIIQIELDPSEVGLHVPVDYALVGHAKRVLKQLLQHVKVKKSDAFLSKIQGHHKETMALLTWYEKNKHTESPMAPEALTHCVSNHAAEDAIFCIDSGLEILWANNYLKLNGKQRFIWSWHLGSLACSIGYSIGCQLVDRKRQVIVLTGDGGFDMLIGDFATLVKYNIPVTIFVFNNSMYGFIQVVEEVDQGFADAGLHFTNPDYAKLAEAYGGVGYSAKTYNELDKLLPEALGNNRPTIVDVSISHGLPAPSSKIQWQQAYHFIKSKISEEILKIKKK